MLVYGRFQDENGVKYHVPALFGSKAPEKQIIRTARAIAREKHVRMVRVWGVYETERLLPCT